MPYPKREEKLRICIANKPEGVTLYGNRAAFRSLARWMDWLAESPPNAHYECHVGWHLESQTAKSKGRKKKVWVLHDPRSKGAEEFDVSFMVLEAKELDRLSEARDRGILPEYMLASDDE
jgi:hypothetical protein